MRALNRRDLPAWVLPWAAEIPLVPGPHAGVGKPVEVRSGVYAAFYPDGQLHCVALAFHGRLQEYLWLSPEQDEGFVASGPPWWVAQAYYRDRILEDFSPDEPPRRRPADSTFRGWAVLQLTRILEYGAQFHTPRVPSTSLRARVDAWQDLVSLHG